MLAIGLKIFEHSMNPIKYICGLDKTLRPPKVIFDVNHLQCNGFFTFLHVLKNYLLMCDLHVDHIIQIALALIDRK